ncbi:Calx-beta domain-containing protein [Nitrosomonas sp.]|uniref:Calx-beta domain-containing protein n=1 Tax=Nitrosomonas sp. TaxID=42353 RepID=UPI0026030F74|nr:Calx-beta domain-containing protein [Nitrosomonas sp.]
MLSSPSANATIADSFGLATIIDNDAPSGTPVVSINDFVVDEASKEAAFVITLDRPSTSAVTMNYATQNGTAIAGADFVAKTGSLSFAPGETAKTVKVTVTNDAAFENAEAFNLALSALTNATTLDGVGTATIFENDAAPVGNSRISVDDVVVDESQTYADFLVRLDAPNTAAVTVNYATSANTAAFNPDYPHFTGSLMFAPGEMVKTVRVSLLGGTTAEVAENLFWCCRHPVPMPPSPTVSGLPPLSTMMHLRARRWFRSMTSPSMKRARKPHLSLRWIGLPPAQLP